MGDHEHCHVVFVFDAEDFILKVHAGKGIQGAKGFVQKKNFGVADQGAGKACPLLHTAGNLVRVGVFKAFKADQVDDVLNVVFLFLKDFAGFESEGYVSFNCEPGKEV